MLLKDAAAKAPGKKPVINLTSHSQNLESPITHINQTDTEEIDDIIQYQHENNQHSVIRDQLGALNNQLTQHVSTMLIESQDEAINDGVGGVYDDDEDAMVLMGDQNEESSLILASPAGKKKKPYPSDEIDLDNGLLQQYEHVMNFG